MRCVQRRACPRPLHLNLFPTSTPPLINYACSLPAQKRMYTESWHMSKTLVKQELSEPVRVLRSCLVRTGRSNSTIIDMSR